VQTQQPELLQGPKAVDAMRGHVHLTELHDVDPVNGWDGIVLDYQLSDIGHIL
jgi:hypothetical protein